jgi:formylmethanofuran dehydrogenase subunit A
MQCLARDATEVAELQEEVTRAQVATVMARAHAAQVEGMAREKATLLATAHDEVARATQRVSILGDQLVTTC